MSPSVSLRLVPLRTSFNFFQIRISLIYQLGIQNHWSFRDSCSHSGCQSVRHVSSVDSPSRCRLWRRCVVLQYIYLWSSLLSLYRIPLIVVGTTQFFVWTWYILIWDYRGRYWPLFQWPYDRDYSAPGPIYRILPSKLWGIQQCFTKHQAWPHRSRHRLSMDLGCYTRKYDDRLLRGYRFDFGCSFKVAL